MKPFDWNAEKNQWLMEKRGISFENVLYAIQSGDLLDDAKHPMKRNTLIHVCWQSTWMTTLGWFPMWKIMRRSF